MKTRFTLVGIIAIVVLGISTFFVGCKEEGLNDVVKYHGQVVYINTTTPFPDLTVKVTDGHNTHCQTQTDAGGLFSLKVRVSEIDGNYYLLAGDSTCVPKRIGLGGYGQSEVDLGVIEVEGPALPTVVTNPIQSVTADAVVMGGEVKSNGRLPVTARGICYGPDAYPTIDGLHTTDGSGLGTFTSNLKNLEYNTIYYARAYATNKLGTAYGEQVKFTTEEGVAIVVTDSVIRITAHSAKCKGHVESDGGFAVTKRGTCWSKRPDPTVDDDCTDDGSGKGEFTSTMKDLVENTTYYVRTYATNSTATVYGEQIMITTLDGLAVVKTDSVRTITATGFTAYGTVVSDCDIQVTARGFCYATTQYPTIDDKCITVSKGLGSFKATISGLDYATTYYVRAYATNATATSYGEQIAVTTLSGLPKVSTDQVTNIGSVKATCGGNVTDDGTLSVTARGVCYGTEQQPTVEGSHTTDGKGTGKFVSNLKNLQDKTTYYVRAYATTAAGTAYGEQKTFKTENGLPVVSLSQIGEPTANSVTCKGNVTGDGGVTITERGFCYSTAQYPTNTDACVKIGNGTGEFEGSLTKLMVNTTYYVRAYALNSIGVGYSEQKSFTTQSGLPSVTTAEPTATATTITVGGSVTDNGGYSVTDRGVCYSTSNSEPTVTEDKISGGKGNGDFSVTITGLSANTTYHLRAYATNENGTVYGKSVSIQTKDGSASVTLGAITGITASSASVPVTVTDVANATLLSCGVCWSTNPNPTIDNDKVVADGKKLNTAYTCNMSGLTANQKYYVRAYATTDAITTYSEQKTFITTAGLASVSTGTSTTTSTTITCTGEVTDDSGYSVTERGICYSLTNAEPTITDSKLAGGSGKGTFSVTISKLTPSTKYYIRAYAININGPSYGNVISATTKNGAASVNIEPVSNITALTASSQVTVTDVGGGTLQSCGVCWATNPNPTIEDSKTAANGNVLNTAYNCNMSGLSPNTTYYVRGYATTDVTTTYSEQITFKTATGLPVLTTLEATSTTTTITSGGNITSDGGYAITARGICWSTTNSTPDINDKVTNNGKGTGSYSSSISELTANTTYYVRAYATNQIGTAYGNVITIKTTNGIASGTLGTVTDITALTASCTITISGAGGATLKECGICWSTTQNPTVANNKTAGGNQVGITYNCNMSGLTPNTTYYVRGYATTDVTTSYSKQASFKTTTGLPVLTTTEPIATSTTVTSGGNITSDGGYTITARGICYSTSNSTPTIADQYTTSGTGTGNFSSVITNVSVSTTYYVRAYATNSIGTSYGNVATVKTGNGMPTVVTTVIGENVTETTAVSGGQVTDDGGSAVIARGVCWNTLPYPTVNDNKTTDGSGIGYYSSTITEIDLTSSNTYYVRAYATNKNGTAYGEQVIVNKEYLDYKNLPKIEYGGYIYVLYNDIGKMSYEKAITACENLIFAGINDWEIPEDVDLLEHIMQNYIKGWKDVNGNEVEVYFGGSDHRLYSSDYYWTRSNVYNGSSCHPLYVVYYEVSSSSAGYKHNINTYGCMCYYEAVRVRPVRKYKATE